MPHAVIAGPMGIPEAFARLEPILWRRDGTVLKTGTAYLDRDGRAMLVEAAAIEGGAPVNFLVLVNKRDDGVVVRLHPSCDVEKTDGVKRLLAILASRLLSAFPGTSVGKTNLEDYMEGPQ